MVSPKEGVCDMNDEKIIDCISKGMMELASKAHNT